MQGNACDLPKGTQIQVFSSEALFYDQQELGSFDLVLMANLIDRLYKPTDCLALLPGLVNPGMYRQPHQCALNV